MAGKTMEIPKATNLNNDMMKKDICKIINAMKDERTEQNNTVEYAIHRENNVTDGMKPELILIKNIVKKIS